MKAFWELFRESVIIQAAIALVLLVTIAYMYATGQEVPDQLVIFFSVVLGFYFGSKVENIKARRL